MPTVYTFLVAVDDEMAAKLFSLKTIDSNFGERDSLTPCNINFAPCNIYRLLNVNCEIFGTSSYGEGRTSLRVRVRHMNECRMFHNINSIIFLLYSITFYIDLLLSSVLST